CAAIPDTLLESELFGYERGAFTGAHTSQQGKLKLADGGTVFCAAIPEEFALQQGIRYCGAVDANDWLASSRTVLVNQLSNNLLSSPRFAGDKDVAVGLGDLLKLSLDVAYSPTIPKQAVLAPELRFHG